jgi:hypothetical protein
VANEIVEGPDVEWAYRRAADDTYHERLRTEEPVDSGSARTFYTARGSC